MDYLGALRLFVRAVELGSFSKAAIAAIPRPRPSRAQSPAWKRISASGCSIARHAARI